MKPELEIQVFEKSGYISYRACSLPYFVGGMIAEPDDLVAVTRKRCRTGNKQEPLDPKPESLRPQFWQQA